MINNTKLLKKRKRSESSFRLLGLSAVIASFIFLGFLLFNIIGNGYSGFTQTQVKLNLHYSKQNVESKNYAKMIREAMDRLFPEITSTSERRQLYGLVTSGAKFLVQDELKENPDIIGGYHAVWLPADENLDIYYKQNFKDWETRITPKQKEWAKKLEEEDQLASKFNWLFFSSGDSQEPEIAGILGALIGSFFLIVTCMVVALPLGVMTAIYLEEFAPKNRFTDIIEMNINNLAAVPSIVFGLLGLAVYLNIMGMPRSAPLVGGLTLALMIMPVIIITTRASIKAVPPSIRQAAMALGASPLQVVLHHTLPLAMPGIMTGTILGIARALGETAPLLMIGMVAFIADVPEGFTDPATAMPVQIFLWAKNNQPGFVEKTAAAILVLLAILIIMNIVAVWIRKKYERRWS